MVSVSKFPDLGGELTHKVIGCAIEVHKTLGAGLLESAYESCLIYELQNIGLDVKSQVILPIQYKDMKIDNAYRIDLLVEDKLIIELKSVENIQSIHKAQIISYMRLSQKPLGLLINFNTTLLKNGIERFALEEFSK